MSCGCKVKSKGEIFVADWLEKRGIPYKLHATFPDCLSPSGNKLSFDFWLRDKDLLIECNGIQHYQPVGHFGGERRYTNQCVYDAIKVDYAKSHNYPFLILDCRGRKIDKVKFSELLDEFIEQNS